MLLYKTQSGQIYSELDYCLEITEPLAIDSSYELKIEAEDFTALVPGEITLAELDAYLSDLGLISSLWGPRDYSVSRILGEDWGHKNQKQVLGFHVRDINGIETKTGGKVIKNVSGYDLSKIYIGSYNALALITGVNLRLEKLPEFSIKISLTISDPNISPEYFQEILIFLSDFDTTVSFSRAYKGQIVIDIELAATQSNVSLKIKKVLTKLEKFFKVEFSNIDVEENEAFYQSKDKKYSIHLQRKIFQKHYPSTNLRIEILTSLSSLGSWYRALILAIEKTISSKPITDDYTLIIHPQSGAFNLYLNASVLELFITKIAMMELDLKLDELGLSIDNAYVNIYPVNPQNKSQEKQLNNAQTMDRRLIQDLKALYDPQALLNPGML